MAINLGVAEGYIELDFSALKQACAGAVKELEKIDREGTLAQSELRKLEAASTGVKGAFQEAANASKKLSVEIDSAKRRVDTYQKGIQELNSHISQSKQKQEQLKQEIEKTAAQYDRSQKKVERMAELHGKESEEYQKAAEKAQEHRNKLNQLENQYEMLGRGIEESENRIVDFKTQINNTEAEISDLTKGLNAARNKAQVFGEAAKEAGEKWQAAGQKISGVGNALTMGVTTPLLAAGTASVKMALDAESSFSKVSTIADQTVLSYDRMKTGVVEASNQSGIAIVDFNEALYQAISAGVDSGNAIAFTTNMVKLAKGGFTETSKAVDVVTTALNAYGLEASEASAVSDKLIVTQNLGKTTVDELAASLGRVIPTAKNVNVDFDNVSAAMATLTKNGIATAEATTYYNSMLNELGKSGTAADKALRQLTKKGFAELITSGSSMTDILTLLQDHAKKSGKSLSDMFGSAEASKAALTIMKNDGKEYNQILKEMQKSAGATEKAYKKMNDTDLEKFKREINKLKNAGIQAGSKLLPIVTKGVEGIGKLADSFSKLSPEQQEAILKTAGFAAAVGPVVKVVGTLTSGVGSATKGISGLIQAFGKSSAIGTAGKSLGGVSSVLSAIPAPAKIAAGAVVGVGAAIAAIAIAVKKAEEAAIKANLEEHFGSITLSAEELEDVAKRLTTTDWTIRLDAYIEAKQTLEEYQETLESTIEELNKAKWKVNVGIELSAEEKESYKQTMLDYATQVKDYISQQHYTANLAINTVFTPGTQLYQNYREFSDTYYNGLSEELTKLGSEFAELVNQAWEDGVLSQEEIDKLDERQAEIQKKLDEISQARYDLTLDNIQADALEGGLTADSFKQLQEELTKTLDERKKEIEDSKMELLVPWQAKLNNGEIDQKGFDFIKRQIDLQAKIQLGEVTLDAVNVEVDTIKANYQNEIDKASKTFYSDLNQAFEDNIDSLDLNQSWLLTLEGIESSFLREFDGMDEKPQKAIQEMLKNMKPQVNDLAELAAEYKEKGKMIPQSFSEGLLDTYELELMAGNTDHMYQVLGAQMSGSEEFLETYAQSVEAGQTIPEGVSEGIYLATGKVYDADANVWRQLTDATDDALPDILNYLNEAGMEPGNELAAALTAGTGIVYNEATGQWVSIKDAALNSEEEVKGVLSQCGIEASDALVNSLMEKSPEVRAQAVDLLVQMQNASDAEKPGLLMQFQNLGIEVDDSLKNGIISNLQVVKDGAGDMAYTLKTSSGEEIKNITPEFKEFLKQMGVKGVDKLEETVSDTKIDAPDMKDPDWTSEAKNGRSGMQTYLKNNPLTVAANIFSAGVSVLRGYATGGIIDQPEFALVGEAGPESIIPLSAGKRSRALSLWEETGKRLGVPDMDLRAATLSAVSSSSRISQQFTEKMQLEIPVTPVIDYQRLAKTLREQFQKNPIVLEPDIRVTTNPTFVVGSKEIAVTIAPEVDAQLGQINKQRMRGM